MSFTWQVVPIEIWPPDVPLGRRSSPFRGSWTDTMERLRRELRHLQADEVLLQMAVSRSDIRQDGWIRANAKPDHDGVILSFDSKYGPLSYPCASYIGWRENVRAIAIALESLRRVNRYGVTKRGEQYTGFLALPAPGSMDVEKAYATLEEFSGMDRHDPEFGTVAHRRAAKATHPDAGGDEASFHAVQQARAALVAGRGS